MAQVKLDKNMSVEKALRKFKSMCKKEGIIDEVKKRRAYEKPSSKKRRLGRKSGNRKQQAKGSPKNRSQMNRGNRDNRRAAY